ncbi:thiamine pyrophosphate-dependent enzyme [Streptomyces sp. JW3]|uniref:thiamine pyrophosphate-dependent enzyme n=1 Tax=Streptomyces sp. JW3 TaxID=3456955 RepID=UPI003FA4C263
MTFVVLDNGGYAAVRALGRRIGVTPVPGTELAGIDFVGLAESFGCPATSVHRPADLPATLDRVLGEDGPGGPRLLHLCVTGAEDTLYDSKGG